MVVKKDKPGDRGKQAEKDVRQILEKFAAKSWAFDFERMYDARSAGGRFPSQVGDYSFFCNLPLNYKHGVIEVKEVKHDFRLPRKNFDSIPRLRKRELAGGRIVVAVFHSTTGLWRLPPFKHFTDHAAAPSWDLTQFTLHQPEELEGILRGLVL